MERSRKLVLTDWTKANNALHYYFEGNKSKLAKQVEMSRTTVTNFFDEKPVRESEFRKLCGKLRLNWEAVSSVHPIDSSETPIVPPETPIALPSPPSQPDEALFQQVREHCRQKILNQHSRMRLLSGEEIGVDQLYVDVWLLNRSPRTFQVSPSKLLESFDLRNDRLGLGDRIRRDPGFEVANNNSKLVILGKPGSGKTTFLKHLAIDWCKDEFQPDLIAVLIELRRIPDGQWNLIEAIDQELGLENWLQFKALNKQISDAIFGINVALNIQDEQKNKIELKDLQRQLEALPLQSALEQGRLLVLMDGLDEVSTSHLRQNVQDQIWLLATNYPKTRLILTCRTQTMGSLPVGFTSVEVADFSQEQMKQFVQNWFMANGKLTTETQRQWNTFDDAVNQNSALEELARTPVLLSLTCLVLQDEGEIPSQISWLYQKSTKLLLSKWNNAKQIDGWEVGSETYRQLNLEQKEALLIEIATRKFENPKNFVLFQQEEIAIQITEFLGLTNHREGVAVLKAIEAQHGLLIERADELWSFSHLTVQEYFAAQWLNQRQIDQGLAIEVVDQRWQEVLKIAVQLQQPADRLLRLLKQIIDQAIASKPKLQEFLTWVLQKSESTQTNHKPIAIRAVYLGSALVLDRALALDLVRNRALARDRNCDLDRDRDLDFALALTLDSGLANQLRQLEAALPSFSIANWKSFWQWQRTNETQWIKHLHQAMIEHCNTRHDLQFTITQTQQLQRYYDANKFLVELMQIEGAVSDNVRTEIEDSLLLPWSELQRRQS